MKSEELRRKLEEIIMHDCECHSLAIYAPCSCTRPQRVKKAFSLLETAITEAEPTARSDQYSYEAGVADYKSNLLALVRGERV